MSLTRKFLAALGIEENKIEEIITAHSETVTALKEDRDKYKADAERLPAVQQELDTMKQNQGKDAFEVKYKAMKEERDALQAEYDAYKEDIAAKESRATKTNAYKDLLKEAGISERRVDSVLRVSDIDSVKIGEDGKIEGSAELLETIKKEWSEFIVTGGKEGAKVPNPPSGSEPDYGNMSDEEYYKLTYEKGR